MNNKNVRVLNRPNTSVTEAFFYEADRTVPSPNIAIEGTTQGLQEANRMLVEQLSAYKAALRQSQSKLAQSHQLSERLHNSFEEERMRISREIHDQLGQSLTLLKFEVSYIQSHLPTELAGSQQLYEKTAAMISALDDAIEIMHHIASDLRPSILDDFGLTAALEWQARTVQARTGVSCSVIDNAPDIQLSKGIKTCLFRIAQEALTNVVRHAQATEAHLKLTWEEADQTLKFEVQDNGRGIDEPDLLMTKSFGLLGMSERAHLVGGAVSISSAAGKGTTVMVRIPIDPSQGQTE